MKEALRVLAELVTEGVIEDYAICSAHGLVCPVEEGLK